MIELLRTNDLVLISLIESVLADRGIDIFVADQHMSVLEGSAGFLQRRLMVSRDQASLARFALREAGLEGELRLG
jgi:hypothetical protein